MTKLARLLIGISVIALASCAAPSPSTGPSGPGIGSGGSGRGRDALGHRPGPRGFSTVILDAGHGGKDSGATSRHTGQREKDLALDTVRRIRQELGGGFRVIFLRTDDRFIDLDDRVAFANRYGDAILVSMHYNAGPARIAGPETFFWRVDSYSLAKRIQREMEAVTSGENGNRGLVRRRLRLTRNPEIPCVLVEGGYMSSPTESRKLANASYRQALARAVANGIRAQAAHGDAGMGPLPPPINAPMSRPTDAPE